MLGDIGVQKCLLKIFHILQNAIPVTAACSIKLAGVEKVVINGQLHAIKPQVFNKRTHYILNLLSHEALKYYLDGWHLSVSCLNERRLDFRPSEIRQECSSQKAFAHRSVHLFSFGFAELYTIGDIAWCC